jgi:membrane protein DedA with SNARE-associated domain
VAVSDGLTALLHVFSQDVSWLSQLVLLLLPFAHEDLAIVAGAYLVVNEIVPVVPVALCIYAGMVASDIALYGIGAGARRLPWLRRIAVDTRMRDFAGLLKRDLFGLVALGRAVPGVVFVAFVACGFMRVPLARFIVASALISALYFPLMLCLMVFFGGALDNQIGAWTWPILLGIVIAMELVRRRVFGFQEVEAAETAAAADPAADEARSPLLAPLVPMPLTARPTVRRARWRSMNARSGDAVAGMAPTRN